MSDVLIVKENNSAFASEISTLVMREGLSLRKARDLQNAQLYLNQECPAVIFLDMEILNGQGIDLLELAPMLRNAEVVLLTHYAAIDHTLRALHISGPRNRMEVVSETRLRDILARAKRPAKPASSPSQCLMNAKTCGRFGSLYGCSALMQRIYEQIACVAPTGITVFITGESGTGKERVAQTIHASSLRSEKPFIPVNCGAISPQLAESEMFGHEKGSFTGAAALHRGFFEQADGGTLFLDEVTEMSGDLQVKFLRVLETGSFMRVGSPQLHHTDVRIIAATNVPPETAVASGKLREDLYYRLNVFPIQLPPLRERREDISLLAEHFLEQICVSEKRRKRFLPQAFIQMRAHNWPGNVRELRNAVQRGFVMSRSDEIHDEWQTPSIMQTPGGIVAEQNEPLLPMAERSLILTTLERFNGHRGKAAAALGVSPKTLYNRLKKYIET